MDCNLLYEVFSFFYFIQFISAIVILSVLSFSKHRKNLWHDCFGGRPGLYSLVDLLHRGPHRLIYAAIFGAMSSEFLNLAFGGGADALCNNSDSPYEHAICSVLFGNVMVILHLGLFYGPLFACVDTSRPLLGHITGLFYLLNEILGVTMLNAYIIGCNGGYHDEAEISLAVMQLIPSYFFYVVLTIWFLYQIVQDIVFKIRGVYITTAQKKKAHLMNYTRKLLRKSDSRDISVGWINYIFVYEKSFKFPLKFLAPLAVMISLNFQLFFAFMGVGYYISTLVDPIENFFDIKDVTLIVTILAGLIVLVVCGSLLIHLVATVHKHLKLAAQGKFKFYSKSLPSHTTILVNSLKYGGHQIGYFVWAWLIMWIVVFIVLYLMVALYVAFREVPIIVGPRVFRIGLTLVWIPVVMVINKVMCKFVFLEKEGGGKFIAITNKNGFNLFSYFMFLYNAIVGFVSAIIRVLISMIINTLLLFRLDQNIMVDGFKFADLGHKKYLGFLYLEHTYNNPVVNTFVALLCNEFEDTETREKHTLRVRNRRVHNRWLVAYTLINNPSLCSLRAKQVQTQENEYSMTPLQSKNNNHLELLEYENIYPTLMSINNNEC